MSILRKVYWRGVAAWNSGNRPGTTPQQWGMARVNSYITKGKGTYHGADKDLREEEHLKPVAKDKESGLPKKYVSGLSDSTAKARAAHWKKMDKKSDRDPSAYEPAPGDANAKTKESKHTKKYRAMFGEEMHEEIYEACWDGYKQVGVKKKGDRMVPDCVPVGSVKKESIAESGGVKVFKTDAGHIEKYGENNFAVYLDGKKQKAYDSLEAAKKALASGKEQEELDEASKYQIYHPSYSSAVQHALSQAEKQGFTVDMDDYTQKVAFGPKKPSVGKTNSFSITLMDKSGKISKKKLQMQVYGMEGGKYELNMYTEEVKLDEGAVKSNEKLITVKHKDSGKELRVVATAIEKYKRMGYELVKEDVDLDESQAHTAPETVKHYMKGQKTSTGISKWVAKTIDKKKAEVKEAEEFKQGGKPLEKKFNKAFKAMGVDADIKKKTINNVSINEEEKPKKSFKDMKKKKENTSDKDVKAGEKLSGKQEPIDLSPTVDNNR